MHIMPGGSQTREENHEDGCAGAAANCPPDQALALGENRAIQHGRISRRERMVRAHPPTYVDHQLPG
jgi:hypothetical protein